MLASRQETSKVSPRRHLHDPTIHNLVMILDTDRLIFKTFNTMIAEQFKQEADKLRIYFHEEKVALSSGAAFPATNEQRLLRFFMAYVKESLSFMTFSFFKRCRMIIRILHEHLKHIKRKRKSLREMKESHIADIITQNMAWSVMTLLTCVQRSQELGG